MIITSNHHNQIRTARSTFALIVRGLGRTPPSTRDVPAFLAAASFELMIAEIELARPAQCSCAAAALDLAQAALDLAQAAVTLGATFRDSSTNYSETAYLDTCVRRDIAHLEHADELPSPNALVQQLDQLTDVPAREAEWLLHEAIATCCIHAARTAELTQRIRRRATAVTNRA